MISTIDNPSAWALATDGMLQAGIWRWTSLKRWARSGARWPSRLKNRRWP